MKNSIVRLIGINFNVSTYDFYHESSLLKKKSNLDQLILFLHKLYAVLLPHNVSICHELRVLEKKGKLMKLVEHVKSILRTNHGKDFEHIDESITDKLWHQLIKVAVLFARNCIKENKYPLALGETDVSMGIY